MSEKIIYQLQDLKKSYGQHEVLKGITLAFYEGAKIGVIGANGAGKSTLLKIIAGEDTTFEGTARPKPGLEIGYLSQEPPLTETLDVAGNLEEAVAHIRELLVRRDQIGEELCDVRDDDHMNQLLEELDKVQHEIDFREGDELDSHLEQAAHALHLPPMDADVTKLSGGERRRVALCKLLLEHPDMLVLDEPTNHLDAETVSWLETYLAQYTGTVILITHDRYFLDNVVGWMLEVERGMGIPYEGNYTQYLEKKQSQLDVKRNQDSKREKVIARELEWIRKTPKARSTRSKSRLQRYKELVDQKAEAQLDSLELRIPPGPRLGDQVISGNKLTKGYGGRTLFEDLSFDLPPGGILGVIGANGMGKTTLMRIIQGTETPDAGSVKIGSTVQMVYLDQSRFVLDDDKSVFENITEGNLQIAFGNQSIDARAYVARFNFKGEDQQKLLGECSGGMRNRTLLAKMLREPANVLVMDEPTNDLDLETLRVLEEAIQEYPGSAIVVTHDRYFLNRVATHILAFEGDGVVRFHHGDYESYVEWKKQQGENVDASSAKFRKFSRS
jgi:ATP-binding cassette ChvD family protein